MAGEGRKPGRPKKGQRKDGLIAVYADFGRRPDGSRDRKTFYGHTWEEADAKRRAYKADREQGVPFGADKMTVAEWCDQWYKIYRASLKGTNAVSYKAYINRLKDDLGFALMRDVRNAHLQSSLNKMAGMSMSSITKYKMVLQQIFGWARRNKIIQDDPAEAFELPTGTKGTHRCLERWEADFIMEHWQDHRAGFWVMVMLLAGLRRSEMTALDWEQVRLGDRILTVKQASEYVGNQPVVKDSTKTEAGLRNLPICDMLYDVLLTVPEDERTGFVCLSAHGTQITQSAIDRGMEGFNAAMERVLNGEPANMAGRRKKDQYAGMTDAQIAELETNRKKFSIRTHDLRYTYATALYDAGVDEKSMQYYMGHSDVRMTKDLYTRISRERENLVRSKAITFLDSWFAKKPPAMPKNRLNSELN